MKRSTTQPKRICIIAVGASGLTQVRKLAREWERGPWGRRFQFSLHYIGGDDLDPRDWPNVLDAVEGQDIVFLDTMGAPKDFSDALYDRMTRFSGHIVALNADRMNIRALTRLGSFSMGMMSKMGQRKRPGGDQPTSPAKMIRMARMMERVGRALPIGPLRDMRNYFWLVKYWQLANARNIENMLYLVGRDYLGYKDLPAAQPPVTIDGLLLMAPSPSEGVYETLDDLWRVHPRDASKPTIGLLYNSNTYPVDTHPATARLLERLRARFNVLPIAARRVEAEDLERLASLVYPDGHPQIDLLINLLAFRLGQGPMGGDARSTVKFLETLDVPVLHPFFLSKRTVDEWQADKSGVHTGEFLLHFFLPELDGSIEMTPVGAVDAASEGFADIDLIDERVDHLIGRAQKWVALRRKPNREKKLAILFYDYPPGEGQAGSSAFLDTFASLSALLTRLAQEGYAVKPMSADALRRVFIQEGRLNTPDWHRDGADHPKIAVDASTYRQLTADWAGLSDTVAQWGSYPGQVMSRDGRLLVPGIVNGNVFLGVQPSRGGVQRVQDRATYHDKGLAPHHQYVAFYRWLADVFGADACVHVGTHGTLEFLPGKEKAMSGDCAPDYLTGGMPHLYLYYLGNPSEAMIAKRRAHAVMISHMPPPFVPGGLYGEMQVLDTLLDEYREAVHLAPNRCAEIMADIQAQVDALGWHVGDVEDVEEIGALEEIEETLFAMRRSLIPGRLHVMGQGYSTGEATDFIVQFLRDATDGGTSLYAHLCHERGWNWGGISASPHQHAAELDTLEDAARAWVQAHVVGERSLQGATALEPVKHTASVLYHHLQRPLELDALCRALEGRYVPVGLSGDVFRNPEVLPSGRNMVQFDPRRVPSPSAMRRGEAIARHTLAQYLDAHGVYPRSVAVILWGLETAQTQGETVGQILAYLGIRMAPSSTPWEPKLQAIPAETLGRPRVDVTVQICGFFRDMFPNLLLLLQDAFERVGGLEDETGTNYVRTNMQHLRQALRAQGMEERDADELSLARIFGPSTAEYGTGVTQLVKSQGWQNEADLVANYVASLKHVYTKTRYGETVEGLFQQNLQRVQLVSQVRSTRDYEMTDLDHYYEFYGGLSKTVEQAAGQKAMLLVSDTHEGRVRTERVQKAIQRGARTRLLNPRWLDGMLAHDHHGGQQLADRIENLLGLAATTGEVDNCLFDEVNDRLVLDEDMRRRIQDNNPYALMAVVERLLEAEARGYWEADPDKLEQLKQVYLQLEGDLEGASFFNAGSQRGRGAER
jgi:cobaltochelatase CobN